MRYKLNKKKIYKEGKTISSLERELGLYPRCLSRAFENGSIKETSVHYEKIKEYCTPLKEERYILDMDKIIDEGKRKAHIEKEAGLSKGTLSNVFKDGRSIKKTSVQYERLKKYLKKI